MKHVLCNSIDEAKSLCDQYVNGDKWYMPYHFIYQTADPSGTAQYYVLMVHETRYLFLLDNGFPLLKRWRLYQEKPEEGDAGYVHGVKFSEWFPLQ